MPLEWTVLLDAEPVLAGAVLLADVVDFFVVVEGGFLLEADVDFAAVDFFTVEWVVPVEVVFLAVSAVTAGAKTVQMPNQAPNNDAIRIRFIDSV